MRRANYAWQAKRLFGVALCDLVFLWSGEGGAFPSKHFYCPHFLQSIVPTGFDAPHFVQNQTGVPEISSSKSSSSFDLLSILSCTPLEDGIEDFSTSFFKFSNCFFNFSTCSVKSVIASAGNVKKSKMIAPIITQCGLTQLLANPNIPAKMYNPQVNFVNSA